MLFYVTCQLLNVSLVGDQYQNILRSKYTQARRGIQSVLYLHPWQTPLPQLHTMLLNIYLRSRRELHHVIIFRTNSHHARVHENTNTEFERKIR
jgi:hypothetical protein